MDKTAWLHRVRCTQLERAVVDALAHRDGIKYPEALRHLVREGAKAEGLWPNTDTPTYDPTAVGPDFYKDTNGVQWRITEYPNGVEARPVARDPFRAEGVEEDE